MDAYERARLLERAIDALVQLGADRDRLRLLPKRDHDSKGLAHFELGEGALDSDEVRFYEYTADEAIDAVERGHPGFAVYYGMERYGTENVGAVDVDERETFPYEDLPTPTVKFISGSGAGDHLLYANDGIERNSVGKGEVDGEVRFNRLYTVLPGSTHPSGGVYEVDYVKDGVVSLSPEDLPESIAPRTTARRAGEAGDDEAVKLSPPDELAEAEFTNKYGVSLDQIRSWATGLDRRLSGLGTVDNDRSAEDFQTAIRLAYWGFSERDAVDILRRYRKRDKSGHVYREYARDTVVTAFAWQTEEYDHQENEVFDPRRLTILPQTRRTRKAACGWNWTGETEPSITQAEARERTDDVVREAFARGNEVVVDALMSLGKSYSSLGAAADRIKHNGDQAAYFTSRTDLYEQAEQWANEDHALASDRIKVLPSMPEHCAAYNGEYGEETQEAVRAAYANGATAAAIHEHVAPECAEHGCEYKARADFDPDEYDLLIGHYKHAHVTPYTSGRHLIFDEHPQGAFQLAFSDGEDGDTNLSTNVTRYVLAHEELPFDSYHDVIENRRDPDRLREAKAFFDGVETFEADEQAAITDLHHAHAAAATYTLVFGHLGDEEYPCDRAQIPSDRDQHRGVYYKGDGFKKPTVVLETPPELRYRGANGIVCLDGTPVHRMWERALGRHLDHRRVLTDDEREEYLRETLGHVGVRANENPKPYTSGEYVTVEQDGTLFEGWADRYGDPVVFTTQAAERQYREEGLTDEDGPVEAIDHYGALTGSNEYKDKRSAIVSGSHNYGEAWVKINAAFEGETVESERVGNEREYGDGEEFAYLMHEAQIAQAALRVGRDGNGAVVGFNTNKIPDWYPVIGDGGVIRTYTPKQRGVVRALQHLFEYNHTITTADVWDHPDCEYETKEGLRRALKTLDRQGFMDGELDGRAYEWRDDGIHEINERGEIELTGADPDEVMPVEETQDQHIVSYMPVLGVPADQIVDDDPLGPGMSTGLEERDDVAATDGPPPG